MVIKIIFLTLYLYKQFIMKKDFNSCTLAFSKNTLVELNADQMKSTQSGSSNICWAIGGYITGEILEGIYQYTEGDCGCP